MGAGTSKPLVPQPLLDDLLAQANKPINDTGQSQPFRAWDKHDTSRPDGTFDPLTGNVAVKNGNVNNWIRDFLTNPQAIRIDLSVGGVEYRLPNGKVAI